MKSNLITRGGHDLLVAELKHLWHEERPEVTKKVNWAASLGDRSENEEGEVKKLRIVGVDEIYDHHPQHISIDSPMARALLAKEVDDEVDVITPLGKKTWFINSISYEKD